MANWFRNRNPSGLLEEKGFCFWPSEKMLLLLFLCFPIIGSRSIGGSLSSSDISVALLDNLPSTLKPVEDDNVPMSSIAELSSGREDDEDGIGSSSGEINSVGDDTTSIDNSNPCALMSMALDEKLMPYDEKPLITVSHHVFDVSQGIVPNIMYTVEMEVPSGHQFSLEYWLNGLTEERSRLKRRHQRDHRDILELYFNASSSHHAIPVIFCSRSSLGGENKDTSSTILSFNWFINGNNVALPSNNGLPSTITFRLRFKSLVSENSSIFKQTLSILIRPECYLVMQIQKARKLSLDYLWNSPLDNKGINCTILLIPKVNFGLEIRLVNFSIYGMRDICKGRYLSFRQTQDKYNSNEDETSEFANKLTSHGGFKKSSLSLERKFCGKLEDYSIDERLLTFIAPDSSPSYTKLRSMSPSSSSTGFSGGGTKSDFLSPIVFFPASESAPSATYKSDRNSNVENNNINNPHGILVKVILPGSVKNKETFNLDISSLSPCQRVVFRDLDGEMKYSKNSDNSEMNEECSIVIHVPYGNRIITKMTLSSRLESDKHETTEADLFSEDKDDAENNNNGTEESDNSRSNTINISYNNNMSNNYYNYNDSDLDTDTSLEGNNNNEMNYVTRTSSYECPIDFDSTTSSSGNSSSTSTRINDEYKRFMLIKAEDIDSGSEFTWCFDSRSSTQVQHKRAWKSSGNKVKIIFQLKYFDVFHLTYQTVNVPEITGECEQGWVAVEGQCLSLVETSLSWTNAEENCQLKGGHLATIANKEGELQLQKIITESALFHPNRAYWIGANDRESEGNFQWTSGLPFSYKNWFTGWTNNKHGEMYNAQPNDDGWSGQDCVEIRQILKPSITYSSKPLSSLFWNDGESSYGKTHHNQLHNTWPHSRFYWNDRNCEARNFYACEKATHKDYDMDFSCNKTLQLSPSQTASLTVTSPAYPASYPDNIVCITMIETLPGYRIVASFDEFVLEESPGCQYDALEIAEIELENEIGGPGRKVGNGLGANNTIKLCGDKTKKLKLLRYKTSSSSSSLRFKFESDFSHHFAGFKASLWAEKDVSEQCADQQMRRFKSHCYLTVAYPAVNWVTAQRTCSSFEGKLASVVSLDEWEFLSRTLPTTIRYDKKSTFWIGGIIDQNNQLVWSDHMPFNFTAFHSSDLQTISNWKCLRIYWHEGGRTDFAWKLADCNQLSGYVCKAKSYAEEGPQVVNKTYSGTGGRQTSPNYPSNYINNLMYTSYLIAPRGTQIVIRFSHLDIEDQEDCLYDYVEIIDRRTKNSTRYCGTYTSSELEKLDYVSTSNEVDVFFHSDFSDTKTGFEIIWRAVDVASCISGKTILTGMGGNGFPIQDAMIHTPNFPHFNLPDLNCIYTIVAPAGQRIWLSFQIFEMGQPNYHEEDCEGQDHVIVELDAGNGDDFTPPSSPGISGDNQITLCGNLTSSSQRTSFMSLREKIRIRVISPVGKSGRGFLGRFKAVPGQLVETLNVATNPNSTLSLPSINYPMRPPENLNVTVSLFSPPEYVLTVNINGTSSCLKNAKSYLEIRDPYHSTNGTTWKVCQIERTTDSSGLRDDINLVNGNENDDRNVNNKRGRNEISLGITQMTSAISFRSTFNRLDIRQVYLPGFHGKRWIARILTTRDENFRAKVITVLRPVELDSCINNPCANGGSCVSENGKYICRCPAPFTGSFCGLSLCDLRPCIFGDCILREKSSKCLCQIGYGGDRCDRRMMPCDDNPCSGHGNCVEVNVTLYKCLCHAWWEGPQCESRMTYIPFKPLSQRVLEEPFWLGLITVTGVLGFIGLIWCVKRHFPEKLEKLLNEDLDKNRGISWVSTTGRSPSSFRTGGGGSSLGMRDPIPGTSQQAVSPPTSRSFLGRFGIRKPSLLSLSSATSNVSVAAVSPHTYENRTFSLDDLLRPSRSMMRTPSPHRRRNYSVQVRRDPAEKQQILQQLVSAGGSTSLDGETRPLTPKPTLAEIIQMSERRLRLASASSMQSEPGSSLELPGPSGSVSNSKQGGDTDETSFSINPNGNSNMTPAAIKAEKKVTFARMLDKLAASEMTSSSSCSDVSCAEDTKMVVVAPKPPTKKDRKGRFRRSKAYQRGRNSETDQDCMDISSSDTTPDPIYTPKLPTRLCISPTGLGASYNLNNSLSLGKTQGQKIPKIASADSLLALFRRFSGSNSAPPSPQYSENEESSAGATPLSTPSSPRSSLLSIRPPALLITAVPEPNNTIELPVIDPFGPTQGWRAPPSSSITLEVPMRDYCLSPIHEVPTPIGTPSHSPCHTPMMKRSSLEHLPCIRIQSSEDDDTTRSSSSSSNNKKDTLPPRILQIPAISISVDDDDEEPEEIDIDGNDNSSSGTLKGKDDDDDSKMNNRIFHQGITGESEVIPDVLIHVPPDACVESLPECESSFLDGAEITPVNSPRIKSKPPPLVFANEILSCSGKDSKDDDRNAKIIVPLVSIEYATPIMEHLPKFPTICIEQDAEECLGSKQIQHDMMPNIISAHTNCYPKINSPLAPPMIIINQGSEVESDSDTSAQRYLRPNLCFLSPFAGASDRVPSESNLSTSGYSSMNSYPPSRCPSVSPLCPSEVDDYHNCCHPHNHHRRSSLTPGTPKKPPMTPRRSSLNTSHLTSGFHCDSSDKFTDKVIHNLKDEIETDSAVEVETDVDCIANMSEIDNPPLTPLGSTSGLLPQNPILLEDMKCINALLQVPKKGMPKSRSLDIYGTGSGGFGQTSLDGNFITVDGYGRITDKKGHLRGLGPSLDSKLNSIDPSANGSNGVTIVFPLSTSSASLSGRKNSGNLIEIPEEKERRLSPVSSRSESPLSELSAAGCFSFLGSPLTDSDGVYDCGSSEVPTNNNETDTATGNRLSLLPLSRLNPRRKSSGRKKDRRIYKNNNKLSLSQSPLNSTSDPNIDGAHTSASSATGISQELGSFGVTIAEDGGGKVLSHLDLPSNMSRDLPNTVSPKRNSPKRRIRAQQNLDRSSSSSESLASSRPRSRTSASSIQNSRTSSRNNSPLPHSVEGASASVSPPQNLRSTSNSPHGGSLEEAVSLKSATDNLDQPLLSPRSTTGSNRALQVAGGPRKISKLRTISHQIRFLRRLELSLMRKKECLTQVSKVTNDEVRRDSLLLGRSDSAEDSSRCDTTSDSSSVSSDSCSECSTGHGLNDNEQPLLTPSSSGPGPSSSTRRHRRKGKVTPLTLLENISARDFLESHKKRIRKYK